MIFLEAFMIFLIELVVSGITLLNGTILKQQLIKKLLAILPLLIKMVPKMFLETFRNFHSPTILFSIFEWHHKLLYCFLL